MSVFQFKALLEELNDSDYELTGDIPYDSMAEFLKSTGNGYLIEQNIDWTDDDLVDECERTFDLNPKKVKHLIEELYELKRNNRDFSHIIDKLIYDTIGRI